MIMILKMMDIFAHPISLRYDNYQSYSTQFGRFLSQIFALLLISLFYYFGRGLFDHSTPILIMTEPSKTLPTSETIGKNTYPIAFGFQTYFDEIHFIDESMLYMEIEYHHDIYSFNENSGQYTKSKTIIQEQLKLCTESDFSQIFLDPDWLQTLPSVQKLYCLPDQNTYQNLIQPSVKFSDGYVMNIKVKICDENYALEKGITCANDTNSHDILQKLYFTTYFTRYELDPFDQFKPLKLRGTSEKAIISKNLIKNINLEFQHILLDIDVGIFFDEIKKFSGLLQSTFKEMMSTFFGEQSEIANIVLSIAKIEKRVFIKYKKFQDVTAELSGTLSLLVSLCMVLMYPYVKDEYATDLINKLFLIENCDTMDDTNTPQSTDVENIERLETVEVLAMKKKKKFKNNYQQQIIDRISKISINPENIEEFQYDTINKLNNNISPTNIKEGAFQMNVNKGYTERLHTNNLQSFEADKKQLADIHIEHRDQITFNRTQEDKNFEDSKMIKNIAGQFPINSSQQSAPSPGSPVSTGSRKENRGLLIETFDKKIGEQIIGEFTQKIKTLYQTMKGGIQSYFMCRDRQSQSIYLQGMKYLNDSMDIVNLIQKLQEIDQMKQILFDRHQYKLFNFLDNPIVTYFQQEDKVKMPYQSSLAVEHQHLSDFDDYVESSYESYCQVKANIIQATNIRDIEINERLISNISPQVKQIFDNAWQSFLYQNKIDSYKTTTKSH